MPIRLGLALLVDGGVKLALFVTVLFRVHTDFLFEYVGEIVGVVIPHLVRDFVDRKLGKAKQFFGALDTKQRDIFGNAEHIFLFEQLADMRLGVVHGVRDFVQRDVFRVITGNIVEYVRIKRRIAFICAFLRRRLQV